MIIFIFRLWLDEVTVAKFEGVAGVEVAGAVGVDVPTVEELGPMSGSVGNRSASECEK
jgi:hypothetical protein